MNPTNVRFSNVAHTQCKIMHQEGIYLPLIDTSN